MVTSQPAAAMGWQGRLGVIAAGALADFVIVDDRHADPYRNLIEAIEENVRLVVVRGEALYGDAHLMKGLREPSDIEALVPVVGKRAKFLAPNCANSALPIMSLAETMTRIQDGLSLSPTLLAKRVGPEQFARDFSVCNMGKPSDPPSAEDASTLLSCRYGLPFEKTLLSPLMTNGDADFFNRLRAIAHLPTYLHALPEYYVRN